jgi:hypothetical protein
MNYAEIVAASIAYSDRYDADVSSSMPTYILMTEAKVNRLLKTRKQSMRAYVSTVADKEFYALPPDWAGMRGIQMTTPDPVSNGYSTTKMSLLDPISFEAKKSGEDTGSIIYCVIANQIQIYPVQAAGSSIEIIYYQTVPNLNQSSDTNWLSEDHPDIYLAGITAEISLFAKDYETASGWYDRLTAAVSELDNVDWLERWSGDVLQVRLG